MNIDKLEQKICAIRMIPAIPLDVVTLDTRIIKLAALWSLSPALSSLFDLVQIVQHLRQC